jgi:hypothetical protein
LLQGVRAVEGIALCRDIARVGNDSAKFILVRAVADSRRENYVFLDQDAADIVGPELQTDLTNLNARSKPA